MKSLSEIQQLKNRISELEELTSILTPGVSTLFTYMEQLLENPDKLIFQDLNSKLKDWLGEDSEQ